MQVMLDFTNPLDRTLTDCKFNISGTALIRNQVIGYKDVPPKAAIKANVSLIPKSAGDHTIVATFTSKQLLDVTGSTQIEVFEE